jgi:hypothetical protein
VEVRELRRENNTFKTNDVKDLIIKGFKTITPEKWTNLCNHVENKIEPQYWKSQHIIPFMGIEVNNRDQNYLKTLFILTSTYQ